MQTSDFDYELPRELIAQDPPAVRGTSRMLVLHRDTGALEHRHIGDIVEYLTPKDLIILNNTKVFPARLRGYWKDTGGALEILLTDPLPMPTREAPAPSPVTALASEECCWSCITGSGRPVRAGAVGVFANGEIEAEIVAKTGEGVATVVFHTKEPLAALLDRYGATPVPPYIHRDGDPDKERLDRERYQTIYAKETGAVAAPTAGLHFTDEIFQALDAKGVHRAFVTLHVGPGTFKPVKVATVEAHHMDAEHYTVPPETAEAIAACRRRGGRVVCVGSTSVRTLETVAAANAGRIVPCRGASSIFIYPPFQFRATDVMLTNFHLPQSTLIMMVSALATRELIFKAYREAIAQRYRFFSYGDCMLIL